MDEKLRIGSYTFDSRIFLGTGKYESLELMDEALAASGTEVVTVAVRRVKLGAQEGPPILEHLQGKGYTILPNTAGCTTREDAVRTARLAREALDTDLIKLEVIGDPKTLFPDNRALFEAAKELVADGFTVLPYTNDDVVLCKALEDIGCPAVMPAAAPIGSGLGVRNPYNIVLIKEAVSVPVIVDAGVGTASDVTVAFELGVDGILMNTGVACARDPVAMARAMKHAATAGRLACLAGRIPKKMFATASSPIEGLITAAPKG